MKLEISGAEPVWAHFAAAAEIINAYQWTISMEERDDVYHLRSGGIDVATFDSLEELEVFTAGMALAFVVIPHRRKRKTER